ncbi:polysaccharide biosynthesis/export family protein [Prosthecomicrobium sp. N25]|uniref:polysaccharide biosynthesis/export family protein n=1 Tax=Prosthecomicrobium sp. N25 TaxID=3129254 RepID=UPI003076A575
MVSWSRSVVRDACHRVLVLTCALIGLAGCSTLPTDGPSAAVITSEGIEGGLPSDKYLIQPLDEATASVIGPWRPRSFADLFTIRSGRAGQPIGIGDVLDIRIMEAGDNGLFANTQTRGAQFQVQVDETGDIFVPYIGRVRAAGRAPEDLRSTIQTTLADKAIQPQVLLTVTGNQANAATVVGDVNRPGRYALNVGGTRLLDAVALAGGSRFTTYETTVTLKRGRQTASVLLEDLFYIPENNVYLRADDEILLSFAPQTYTLLGAVPAPSQIKFETKQVTLAEAIGRGRGLNTLAADASGVFLFRYEEPSLVRRIRPDYVAPGPGPVPTVYRLDLTHPRGFFIAKSMWVRDKDVIYVATAPAVEFTKFVDLLNRASTAGRSGLGAALDAKTLDGLNR